MTFSKSTIETIKKRCEICTKVTIKHQNDVIDVSGVFIVNFEPFSCVSTVDVVIVNWVCISGSSWGSLIIKEIKSFNK